MASTASWANVSALDSSVGSPSTPDSAARRFLPGGSAILPFTALTRAPPSPETNLSGTSTTRTIFLRSGSARAASATDAATVLSVTPMMIILAPSARQASRAPPSTRYGERSSSILSLALPGSPSVPLMRIIGLHLRAAALSTTAGPQRDAFHHFDQLARGHPAHGPKDLLMRREINALKAVQAGG